MTRARSIWSLYSGGKDSTSVTCWLQEHDLLAGVITFDTGIATPDWQSFIERTAQDRGWNLEIYKTPARYDDLVLKYGFAGPAMHGMFMNYLKGRCVRQFKKAHPGAVLASGVRSAESNRRFHSAKEWSDFEGVKVWAPLLTWTTPQVWEYFRCRGFERSPAYQTLCISGDCLCGAYATKFEREIIRGAYPVVNERLEWLEARTDPAKPWGWGNNRGKRKKASPLCVDCEAP